jgi:hypothetical protein
VVERHPAERKVQERLAGAEPVDGLVGLSQADFTTLLLSVLRTRAARVSPPDVLRRYLAGRFAKPSRIPLRALRKVEDRFLSALPNGWDAIIASPVVPFATHAAVASVSQDRVLSTFRATEVAADPTTALALEAAARRRATRDESVRLATVQRVIRGQSFEGDAPSHFPLFALVTTGRDAGGHGFEASALVEHLSIHISGIRASGVSGVRIVLTDLTGGDRELVLQRVEEAFGDEADVIVDRDADREAGLYYDGICFKVRAAFPGDEEFETSDGGATRWLARLLSDRREHLFISASGLNPLAEHVALETRPSP